MPTTRTAEIAAAREADERIAEAWSAYWAAQAPVESTLANIAKNEKFARRAPRFAARVAADNAVLEAKVAELAPVAEALRLAAIALDEELYTGWSRFFHVEHIHSSQHCSSFRPTTRVGWLPKVSGLTEAEAVAEYGAILCTICFPSAPVEWTEGPKDDRCSGSGSWIDRSLGGRFGYYSGNWAICPDCGKHVSVTSKGLKIPKHVAAN
jgi:hypothetical protein